jgi:hypothetical protein
MNSLRTTRHCISALFLTLSFAVLAHAHLPSVVGTVYHDADNDGLNPGDAGLMGITVNLYEDDGDEIFNADIDQMITTDVTDSEGKYAFGSLGLESKFFVQQAAQTVGGISLPGTVSSLITSGSFNMMIDDFKDQQRIVAHPIASVGASNLTSGTVLGGQRDLHIEYLGGSAEAVLHANPFGMNDVLEFNQSAGVTAIATVTWDGIDGDMSITPSGGGLGGIDLTEGGLSQGFAFSLGVDAAGAGENLTMRVFSGVDVSAVNIVLPVTNGTATTFQIVPFDAFVGDADFTSIDAIQLELGGNNPSIDAQIGPLSLIGPTVTNIPVTIPEPSGCLIGLFAVVWFSGIRRKRATKH